MAEVTDVAVVGHKDVVDLLRDQHSEIKTLFGRVAAARGARKRDLFQDLVRLLAVHESAEEMVVHPVARRVVADGDQVVDSRLHEENDAKQALAELYDLGVEHPEFDRKLAALGEAVAAHAAREESDEFRYLRRNLPADRLRRMAGAVRAAEATAPTRPDPEAGEPVDVKPLSGPPVKVFGQVRDAVRDWRQSNRDD
jgi:hemerythrin superfamily protein